MNFPISLHSDQRKSNSYQPKTLVSAPSLLSPSRSMPAEPTKAKLKRRSSRKDLDEYRFDGSHGRELELKRNRGAFQLLRRRRGFLTQFYTSCFLGPGEVTLSFQVQ